jgi:aspartyl-tRNA(Asn)/glutamyl-tRNA(Gln) amidotransferase subunit A
MADVQLLTTPVSELRRLLSNRAISSVELTRAFLKQIEASNSQLNAVVTICADHALQQAALADEQLARGEVASLTGVPLLHKDIFCTEGIRTTCGSRMLAEFTPAYNATVVNKLQSAGAVTLGKCNMDEFAMGSSNETSFFGTVKNPWDLDCVPGGSSGGSAAAIAAGMAPLATGTDTGGSIRQPASLCGITGLKPTYGRVSRLGIIAFASSLDQAGPMARTAEDCALALAAMAGVDGGDSTSADRQVPDFHGALSTDIQGLRIGLPKQFFNDDLDDQVRTRVSEALAELEKAGATLVEIDLPHSHYAIATYYVIAPAEASANLARYDGVRFGHRCDDPQDLEDLYLRSRSEGFGEEVQRRILVGTYALSAGFYDAYFNKAQQVRRVITEDFHKAFEQVDVIAGPSAPGVAFPFGAKQQDPIAMYMEDIYTLAVNLAGLPGLSTPAGFINGMPVGLQLIGRPFDEQTILNMAHRLQTDTDWHMSHPKLGDLAS